MESTPLDTVRTTSNVTDSGLISHEIHPSDTVRTTPKVTDSGYPHTYAYDFLSNSPPQIPYESLPKLPIRDIRICITMISYQIQPFGYRMNHPQSYRFGLTDPSVRTVRPDRPLA